MVIVKIGYPLVQSIVEELHVSLELAQIMDRLLLPSLTINVKIGIFHVLKIVEVQPVNPKLVQTHQEFLLLMQIVKLGYLLAQ
jgi:hypothetical protein